MSKLKNLLSMKEQHKKELISNSYKINLNDDNLDDLLILYKYLNVPISYLKSFYNITKSLDKIYKSSFLSKEFVKMSKIKLNIEKLKKKHWKSWKNNRNFNKIQQLFK